MSEPTYCGRPYLYLVELMGKEAADNYVSSREPDLIQNSALTCALSEPTYAELESLRKVLVLVRAMLACEEGCYALREAVFEYDQLMFGGNL